MPQVQSNYMYVLSNRAECLDQIDQQVLLNFEAVLFHWHASQDKLLRQSYLIRILKVENVLRMNKIDRQVIRANLELIVHLMNYNQETERNNQYFTFSA